MSDAGAARAESAPTSRSFTRAGPIARFAPVTEFVHEGGLVLGICNGFQVLSEIRIRLGQVEIGLRRIPAVVTGIAAAVIRPTFYTGCGWTVS